MVNQTNLTKPDPNTPLAAYLNENSNIFTLNINQQDNLGNNLKALDKDIKDYNTTVQALKAGQSEQIFNQLQAENEKKDPQWLSTLEGTTSKDITNKIESNLNAQLQNVNSEYDDISKINNTMRDTHGSQDIYNTMVTEDLQKNLSKLKDTSNEIATKTRVAEINQEYADSKSKRIKALGGGIAIIPLSVILMGFTIGGYLSWKTFFGIVTTICVIYGSYLIYMFTNSATDPYTSPYTSDFQAFRDWITTAIGHAGSVLTDCEKCPEPSSSPKSKPSPNPTGSGNVYTGDNQGFVYYDGSAPSTTITASST